MNGLAKYFPHREVIGIDRAFSAAQVAVTDDFLCLQYLSKLPFRDIVIRSSMIDFISYARFLRLAEGAGVQVYIYITDTPVMQNNLSELRCAYETAQAHGAIFLNFSLDASQGA